MAQSLAYQYALENQGLDAMYDSIRSFMANNPSPDQIKDAMATYGISPDDVVSATGSTTVPVYLYETESGPLYDYVNINNVAPPQETYVAPAPAPVVTQPEPEYLSWKNPMNDIQQVTTPVTNDTFVAGPTSPTVVGPTPPASNTTQSVAPVNPNLQLAASLDQSQGYVPPGVTKPVLIKDADGKEYNKDTLLTLASQVAQNIDTSKSSGGAYGTNKETIGFTYDTLNSTYGKEFSAGDQVAFDIAKQLLNKGISNYDEVKSLVPTTVTETVWNGQGESGDWVTQDKTVYINPNTGKEVDTWLGATYTGKGGTQYQLDPTTGQVYTVGTSSSDLDGGLGMMLSIGASFLMPGVGSIIAAELGVSQAVGTAIAQAGFQAATGADSKNILLGLALGPAGQELTGFNAAGTVSSSLSNLISDPAVLTLATNAVVAAGTTLLATGGNTNAALTSAAGSVVNTAVTNLTGSSSIGAGASVLAMGGNSEAAVSTLLNTAAYNAGVENRQSVVDLFTGTSSNTASTLLNTANTIVNTGNVDVLGDFINTLDAVNNTGNSSVIDNYINATANIVTSGDNDQLSTFNSTTNNVIVSSNGNTDVLDTFVNNAGNAAISGDLSVYDQILDTFNQGANIVANIANTYGPGVQLALNDTGDLTVNDSNGTQLQNLGATTGPLTDTTPKITANDLTGTDKQLYDQLESEWQNLNNQIQIAGDTGNDQLAQDLTTQIKSVVRQQQTILDGAANPEQSANLTQFINNNAPIGNPDELLAFQQTHNISDEQLLNAQRINEIQTQQILQQQDDNAFANLEPGQFYKGITVDSLSPTGYVNIDGNAVNRDGSLFSGPVMPGQETNVNISNLNLGGQTFDVSGNGPINPGTTTLSNVVLGDANVTGSVSPSDVTRDVIANNVTGGNVFGSNNASANTGNITANNITFQDLANITSNIANIDIANTTTSNIISSASNIANLIVNNATTGNIINSTSNIANMTGSNITTGNIVDSISNVGNILIDTSNVANISNVVSNTGNITGSNLTTGNITNAASNIGTANLANIITGNVNNVVSNIGNLTVSNAFTGNITNAISNIGNANISNTTANNISNVSSNIANLIASNNIANTFSNVSSNVGNANVFGNITGNILANVTSNIANITGNISNVANISNVVSNVGNIIITANTLSNANVVANVLANTTSNTNANANANVLANTNANIIANVLTNANITTNTLSNTNANVNANVLTNVFIPNVNANVTTNTVSNLANIPNIGNITFNTGGLNPGWIEPPPFYNATSPVQSQYYWGSHPYQPGPTFNEVLYNTVPNAPQTPFGLQQMAQPLTGEQINQIAMGKTVIPNNMSMPVNPYDWSKDYNSNNVPMAPVGVVLPTIQTTGPVVPNRATSTSTDPRYADVSKQLGSNWFNKQQAAAQAGDWDAYYNMQEQVNSILNPVIDKP